MIKPVLLLKNNEENINLSLLSDFIGAIANELPLPTTLPSIAHFQGHLPHGPRYFAKGAHLSFRLFSPLLPPPPNA
ncbi:hypothetical protein BC938DRAFT_480384 [Jimgerdemannia flammicorona]|uniref:Uncharacterized protein n=1 Tax=Jimgerdemannia flammicorona TaxID=994334 RepID=A0A433QIP3_9FUNG|nr:hypothetical protein BC938DRAFT_480384 [Jimgerdemannia flammicorona]